MSVHLHRRIDHLKRLILAMGTRVEDALVQSIQSVEERDAALAQRVVDGDKQIDRDEVEIEEECLELLALEQPVALDLRFVVATLKINRELERIADLASSAAKVGEALAGEPALSLTPFEWRELTTQTRRMLRRSLDALIRVDPRLAREVIAEDALIDRIHREMYERVDAAIQGEPERAPTYLRVLGLSRLFERIADHTVNIGATVVYMAEGDVYRGPSG